MAAQDARAQRGTDASASTTDGPEPCDVCGGPTFEVRCKVICRRCGFTRDCGDP
ncbi:MAG TPA: hypothetical protein VI915_01335 [Thermoplasmata archaeon]|nr:hypothetical protein [Thermoplasmata archaeon]HLE45622.1 hypothetical protein [Thermoplasmata archaeon]